MTLDDSLRHEAACVLRCAAGADPMKIVLFINARGHVTSRDIADHAKLTIMRTRSHLSKMGRLGIVFKETVTTREVLYLLTYNGIAVAKCLEILTASLHAQKEDNV